MMDHDLRKESCRGDICRFKLSTNPSDINKLLINEMPFIVDNLSHNWSAQKIWNLGYLNKVVGENSISFGKLDKSGAVNYDVVETQKMQHFLQYIQHYQNNSNIPDAQGIYLITSRLMTHEKARNVQLPELLKDIEVPCFIPYNKLWEINLWIGIGGNRSNLHFDPEENILTILQGSKSIVLFPPNQTKFLYQNKTKLAKNLQSCVDIFSIDRDKYSLIDKAIYYQTQLSEGESLYIPSGWWHAVESSESLNMAINFWWLVKFKHLFSFSNPSMRRLWQKDNKWLTVLKSEFHFYN